MNRQVVSMLGRPIVSVAVVLAAVVSAVAEESADVKAQFADPPREYATAPLWTWNDMLTEEQIVSSMEDLAGQKVKQVFVHPRPGLMTPYLGDDWFRLWKVALQTAERLDMNVWIYDENSYPSGFAGGLVPEAMPEARAKGLAIREVTQVEKVGDDVVAVFRLTNDGTDNGTDNDNGYENVTRQARAGDALPEGRYLVATVTLARQDGWFGGKYYVDLLYPGVTEKFIEVTMEAYRRHFGEEFGRRIPGWFTDEPHLGMAEGLHWADRLPEAFEKRWGYDLVESLPSLVRPLGDWRRVRHNYYQLLLEEFIRCWAQPCYEYCEKHNLEFTGHYWEHGWPDAGHGGDNMAMYAWHQRPAIDTLMNQYREDVHSQFGNVRAVLELASVANQMGRKRTLCEAYGAGGWDLRFEDMKRIGDWLYVLGVNTLDEHIADVTIRGARKRDHPQSFSYHEPWWEAYHVMAEYFTRLSLVMSSGEQVNRILVIEPTTAAWMYQGDKRLKELGDNFQKLVTDLAKAQVEFDLGCEDIIGREGSTDGAALIVGRRRYETVVLPPNTENLDARTVGLIETYLKAGGTVLSCSGPPTHVDGTQSDRGQELARHDGFGRIDAEAASQELLNRSRDGFSVRLRDNSQGILFHHRRQVDDGQFLFLVNTSIEARAGGEIIATAKSAQRWNLKAGRTRPYHFDVDGDRLSTTFSLPPCGSLLLFLSNEPGESVRRPQREKAEVPPVGPMEIRRTGPNVLTLDYVDVTAGGQTKEDAYCFAAAEHVFKMNGLEGNPWHRAVQFRDELITKTFPPQSGFEATYKFTLAQRVPESLSIVIERPDLYTITCNGNSVEATPGEWWLDKSFGRIDLAAAAKVGANAVTIKASPLTMWHELEPAYLLGDFHLKPVDSGFLVVPEKPLALGSWKEQGLSMYGESVGYLQKFNVTDTAGRFTVSLPRWYGSVVRVVVNGEPVGYIAYQPWILDVSRNIVEGENTVQVVVIGTLKNTLGPHHFGDVVGAAWPHGFQQGPATGPPPGEKYHTLDYGLFEPFVLKQAK